MSLIENLFGSYAAVYVGDTDPSVINGVNHTNTNLSDLILADDVRTEGSNFSYKQSEKWVPALGNTLPDAEGLSLSFSLTFYGSSNQALALMMGNSINPSNTPTPDTPGQFNVYTLLLIDNDPTSEECIWIPWCISEKNVNINREKGNMTKSPVHFFYHGRDSSIPLFYKRDLVTLLALPNLVSRSLTTP